MSTLPQLPGDVAERLSKKLRSSVPPGSKPPTDKDWISAINALPHAPGEPVIVNTGKHAGILIPRETKPDWFRRTANNLLVGFRGELAQALNIVLNAANGIEKVAQIYSSVVGKPYQEVLPELRADLQAAIQKLVPPPDAIKRKPGIWDHITMGLGAAPIMILEYGAMGRILRNPALSFAVVDAAKTIDQGFAQAAKAAAIGAVTGKGLGALAKVPSAAKRIAGSAAIGALPGAVEADPSAMIAGGIMGGVFSVKPPWEIDPQVKAAVEAEKKLSPNVQLVDKPDLLPILHWFRSRHELFKDLPQARDTVVDAVTSLRKAAADATKWIQSSRKAFSGLTKEQVNKIIMAADDPKYISSLEPSERAALAQFRTITEEIRQRIIKTLRDLGSDVPDNWGLENYFPHWFEGPWAIYVDLGTPGSPKLVPIPNGFMAKTKREAYQRAQEYLQMNPTVKPEQIVIQLNDFWNRDPLNPAQRARYEELTAKLPGELKPEERKELAQLRRLLELPPRRAVPTIPHLMKRAANLPGWVQDISAFEHYVLMTSRWLNLAPLRRQMLQVQADIDRIYGPNSLFSKAWREYMDRVEGKPDALTRFINDYWIRLGGAPRVVERFTGTVRGLEAVLKLGFSPITAIANFSQSVVFGLPILGGEYWLKGFKGLLRNLRTGEYNWLLEEVGIRTAQTKATEMNFAEALSYSISSGGALRQASEAFTAAAMWMFSRAEFLNRGIVAIGQWEKAMAHGLSRERALRKVKELDIKVNFDYTNADMPVVLTNPITKTLFQFKSFWIKAFEYMLWLASSDPFGRVGEPPKGFLNKETARFLGLVLLTSGIAGIPGSETVDTVFKHVFDWSPLDEVRQALPGASRGLPGLIPVSVITRDDGSRHIVGVDISRNLGFGDWLGEGSVMSGGPIANELILVWKVLSTREGAEQQAELRRLLQRISPMGRRLYESFSKWAREQGMIVDVKGRPVVTDVTALERWFNAMGLTPIRLADERRAYLETYDRILRAQSKRAAYADAVVDAILEGEYEKAVRLMHEAGAAGYGDISRLVRERLRKSHIERRSLLVRRYRSLLNLPGVNPDIYEQLLEEAEQAEQPQWR